MLKAILFLSSLVQGALVWRFTDDLSWQEPRQVDNDNGLIFEWYTEYIGVPDGSGTTNLVCTIKSTDSIANLDSAASNQIRVCIEFAEVDQEFTKREQRVIYGSISNLNFDQTGVLTTFGRMTSSTDVCKTLTTSSALLDQTSYSSDLLATSSITGGADDALEVSFRRQINIPIDEANQIPMNEGTTYKVYTAVYVGSATGSNYRAIYSDHTNYRPIF